jgi:pyrroloquinoline quinone biosynthesis protein B
MGTAGDVCPREGRIRQRVRARLMGTAAGGGLPQWNCACAVCMQARQRGSGRTQDSLAVTGTGQRWYIVNASPDIRGQILAAPELAAGPGRRGTPLGGVLLTDGELDHTIGLLMLREGSPLGVYGPGPVLAVLADDFPLRRILDWYAPISWHEISPRTPLQLDEQLSMTMIPLSAKQPKYAASAHTEARGAAQHWVVAYRFEDRLTGGSLVYAPCLAMWTDTFDEAVADAGCVILDGTFFHDDEMLRATGQDRPAHTMGHLPIADSWQRLHMHSAARKLYTHLNNTNPALAENSAERTILASAGIDVAYDGLTFDF